MAQTMTPEFISSYFPEGAQVEVSQTVPEFLGSWYPATVIEHITRKGRQNSILTEIVVEYKDLKENNDIDPLREAVRPSQLRPIPPKGRQEQGLVFANGDQVDASRRGGWWEGMVTGVLMGDSKYVVFSRGLGEEMEFEGSMLRVHREWVKGRWMPEIEEENTVGDSGDGCCRCCSGGGHEEGCNYREIPVTLEEDSGDNISKHAFKPRDLVEVSNDEEGLEGSWYTATILDRVSETKYLIEYKTLKDENGRDPLKEEADIQNLRPTPPVLEYIDRFEVLEQVEAFHNDGWWEGVIHKVLAKENYFVYFPDSGEILKFNEVDLRVRQEWKDGKWVIPPKVSEL